MGKLAAAHHLVKQAVDKTKLIIVHVEKLLNGAGGIMSDDKVHPVAVGRQLIEGVLGFLNGWLLFFPESFSTLAQVEAFVLGISAPKAKTDLPSIS